MEFRYATSPQRQQGGAGSLRFPRDVSLPPKAVGLTAVHVFGKEKNAEFREFRDRLEKRVPALK